MEERRTETRKKVMAFTPVYDDNHGLLGYLGNLTLQGVMVIGEKPLDANTRLTLRMEFLDEVPGAFARRLVIPARVARCVSDEENSREYRIGFEFLDETPEHRQIIEALLDRYHFRHREWAKK